MTKVSADVKSSKQTPFRLLVAGAGTGGHLYPGVAVAQVLRRSDPLSEILFVVGKKDIEVEILKREDMTSAKVMAAPMPRRNPFRLPGALAKNLIGFVQSLRVIGKFKPDAVFSTGGFISGVVSLAAKARGIPIVVHESNRIPGLANRMMGPLANVIITAYPEAAEALGPKGKALGTPVRPSLFEGNKTETLSKLGLDPNRFTLLVLGGSQGAGAINGAMKEIVDRAAELYQPIQILWMTGHGEYRDVVESCRKSAVKTAVRSFLYNMPGAYAAADLVLSRAGASTLAEILALGLPSILVPYPHAADDHQAANATQLAKKGAALVISQDQLSGDVLASTLGSIIRDKSKLASMAEAARGMGVRDAADKVLSAIKEVAKK